VIAHRAVHLARVWIVDNQRSGTGRAVEAMSGGRMR
jgi:hypothetical protein